MTVPVRQPGPDLSVVLPTYNERANIAPVLRQLKKALRGLRWEAIFVDDDSPDGTAEAVREAARRDSRVRLIHRIGRRGLSSACIEGILASSAAAVAVMDADLQHDAGILPEMLRRLRSGALDLVVGTRNAEGGSMGAFCKKRRLLSRLGQMASRAVCRCPISDPMSGYFMVDREFFTEIAHRLHGVGFKILVDMMASSPRPVRMAEVGYCFSLRRHGASKLDMNIGIDYMFFVLSRLLGRWVPVRFALFSLVGSLGLLTHLAVLGTLLSGHVAFLTAQAIATYVAMTENFFLNNMITYRDQRLKGRQLIDGLASFVLACSVGAWLNILLARALVSNGHHYLTAGMAGILLGSVWNYTVSNFFTWRVPVREAAETHTEPVVIYAESSE